MEFKEKNQKNISGFTLVELLIVITIIGVIAALSMLTYGTVRQKARDTKRAKDIEQIQTALRSYFYNESSYPETLDFGEALTGSTSSTTYMAILPENPKPYSDGDCQDRGYSYLKSATSSEFEVGFCLSSPVGNLSAGEKCLTGKGILDEPCSNRIAGDSFSCPEARMIQYDGGPYDSTGLIRNQGGYYRTVKIGDQCWMRDNVNIGTRIDLKASSPCIDYTGGDGWWSCQNDSNVIEKYCYNNDSSRCDTDGGLYEWPEALGLPYDCNAGLTHNNGDGTYTLSCPESGDKTFPIEKMKGICPTGWHIPNDTEWDVLENHLKESTQTACVANRWGYSCLPAGTKMLAGGDSHFEAILGGFGFVDGNFYFDTTETYFWSNIPTDNFYFAVVRDFKNTEAGIERFYRFRAGGMPLRCLKD